MENEAAERRRRGREAESQDFSGEPFSPQERKDLRRLAAHADDLERLAEVAAAKKVLWDFILKLSAAVTVVAGAVYAVTQFFKGGGH